MATDDGRRLTITEAATALDVRRDTIRRRISAGELQGERDNRGYWHVVLPRHAEATIARAPAVVRAAAAPAHADELLAEVRARLGVLGQELDDVRRDRDHWRALAEAERERVDKLLAALAERRQPARRPWPGLRAWWRRLIEGDG